MNYFRFKKMLKQELNDFSEIDKILFYLIIKKIMRKKDKIKYIEELFN